MLLTGVCLLLAWVRDGRLRTARDPVNGSVIFEGLVFFCFTATYHIM